MKKLYTTILILLLCGSAWGGVLCDDTDDEVTFGDMTAPPGNIMSIAFWFNPVSGFDEEYIISKYDTAGGAREFAVLFTGTVFSFNKGFNSGASFDICTIPDSNITADVWQHILIVINGVDCQIYVDGTSIGTSDGLTTDSFADTAANFLFCDRTDASRDFGGQIEDVFIWHTALTQADATLLAGSKGKRMGLQIPNPIGCWFVDSGPDGTSADGDTFYDHCGTNNGVGVDGANNTGMTWAATKTLPYQ